MNTVLDVLFLRKPQIEYVSPPVCEAIFSGSGTVTIILDPLPHLIAPTGPILGGFGGTRRYLTWNSYPGQICYSIYFEADPGNPNSPYNLISECIPNHSIRVCSAGYFKITAITPAGESAPTTPVFNDGNHSLILPLPQYPGATGYNLYKNPETANPNGVFSLEIGNFFGNLSELCSSGCYRVSSITGEGETPLSEPICLDCLLPQPCPTGAIWHPEFCACGCPTQPCDTGFVWDSILCECVSTGGGGDTQDVVACLNEAYGTNIIAPSSFVEPCTFTLDSGELPPGILLTPESDITASIAGVPTTPGVYNFIVKVTDSASHAAGYQYNFRVFGFTNGDPTPATPNEPYTFLFTADGGVGPYVFSILSGSLPDGVGLTSDGVLAGTPTASGAFDFVVQVVDSFGNTCNHAETLSVSGGPDWASMVWDNVSATGGDAPGIVAAGAVLTFSINASTANGQAIAGAHGSLLYTGGAANCKITMSAFSATPGFDFITEAADTTIPLNVIGTFGNNGNFSPLIFQDSSLVSFSSFDPINHIWFFSLTPGVNSLVEFSQIGFIVGLVLSTNEGYANTSEALTATLANV